MSSSYVLYLAIPSALALAFWSAPVQELNMTVRLAVHAFAFLLCYVPYSLGRYWRAQRPKLATGAYLSANALRLLGIFAILLLFEIYEPKATLPALKIYVISVGAFLVFQLFALFLARKQK